jgi:hypothetical protein
MTARDRIVLMVVCALVSVGAAWLLVISPKRSQASKLTTQITAAQTKLDTVRPQLAAGKAARTAFSASYTTLVRLGEAVPADDNVPSLIYQVQSAATAARVDFRTLVVGGSGASAPAPSASATPSATAALPPGATVGPAGFAVLPFTFTFHGNFFHLSNFLGRLQRFVTTTNSQVSVSGRLMTLNAISLGPATLGFPHITATVSATTYIVPASQGVLAGATSAGPSAGSAQAASTSPGVTAAPAAITAP